MRRSSARWTAALAAGFPCAPAMGASDEEMERLSVKRTTPSG